MIQHLSTMETKAREGIIGPSLSDFPEVKKKLLEQLDKIRAIKDYGVPLLKKLFPAIWVRSHLLLPYISYIYRIIISPLQLMEEIEITRPMYSITKVRILTPPPLQLSHFFHRTGSTPLLSAKRLDSTTP